MCTCFTSLIRPKDIKLIIQFFVYLHNTGEVITPVAIIGRGPYGHEVLFLKPLCVPFLRQLMGSDNKFESIMMIELIDNFMAEEPSGATTATGPGVNLLRVGPHQICKRAFSGNFHPAIQLSNLIKGMNIGRESTMDTKELIFL